MRFLVVLSVSFAVLAACAGSDAPSDAAAAEADPLQEAVERALADCVDPLHDSDGSGGFFEFCARARQARLADRLDCFEPQYATANTAACESWRIDAGDVPPYYFDQPEPAQQESVGAAEDPPAEQEPAADAAPVGAVDEATGLPAGLKILEWNQIGGCQQLGDYCARHSVYADGRVEATRASGEVLSEGVVDVALVVAVMDTADIDTNALVASLPPGVCRMAVDGIDHELWIGPADLRINSCEFDLSGDDPLISASRQLAEASTAAAPVVWDTVGSD